jgi:hypothetical protein
MTGPEQPPGVPDIAAGQVPDLFVTGMEVTQSVQNLDNQMPLVAGRTTVVRVYVQTDGGSVGGVTGAMQVTSSAGPPVVVYPVNGPIVADGDGSNRLDPDGTLNFLLPPAATAATGAKPAQLHVFVYSVHPSSPEKAEPDAANNHGFASVEFHAASPLAIRLFPIHLHDPWPDGPDATFAQPGPNLLVDAFTWAEVSAAAYRYLPTHQILGLPGVTLYPEWHGIDSIFGAEVSPEFREWNLTLDGHHSQVNSVLMAHWEQTTPLDHFEQYYGAIAPGVPADLGGQSNATVAHGQMKTDVYFDSPWYHQTGGKTMAHELAHNVGYKHNKCRGDEEAGGAIEPYPYTGPPCTLAEVDPAGWFGFDVGWQSFPYLDRPAVISNDPNIAAPHRGFPVMGYRNPRWADPYFWCRKLQHFGVSCKALQIPENQPTPTEGLPELVAEQYDPLPGQQGWLRLSAQLDLEHGTAQLIETRRVGDPGRRVLDAYAHVRAEGDATGFEIVLVDEVSEAIEIRELHIKTEIDDLPEGHGPMTVDVATDYVRWYDEAAEIQVRRDGEVVASRRVSSSPPEITVTGPSGGAYEAPVAVTWEASDPDGDPLVFTVSYSPDGGETWTLLARNVAGESFTVSSFDAVPGGDRALFRVEASDGIHTAVDVSDEGTVADGAPLLAIDSPADGSRFALNEPVEMRASAFDWEDGLEAPPTVEWRSDRDGQLATGAVALGDGLSAGEHVLTATAVDAAGNTTEASVEIVVDDSRVLPRATGQDLDDLLAILARGPVAAEADRRIGLSPLLAVILVGGLLYARSRRRRPAGSAPTRAGGEDQ